MKYFGIKYTEFINTSPGPGRIITDYIKKNREALVQADTISQAIKKAEDSINENRNEKVLKITIYEVVSSEIDEVIS